MKPNSRNIFQLALQFLLEAIREWRNRRLRHKQHKRRMKKLREDRAKQERQRAMRQAIERKYLAEQKKKIAETIRKVERLDEDPY